MKYATIDESGWIKSKYDAPQPDKETVKVPDEVEPSNTSKVEEAWNWNGGSPEIQSTGNKIPPEPQEAKSKLFAHATDSDTGWGWDRSKLRTVRQEEGLFFDFLDANNYEEAKLEATDSDNLTDSETQWVHDLLSGATWEQDW
jgi:hypothetical protein